jgi:hypothetical protein
VEEKRNAYRILLERGLGKQKPVRGSEVKLSEVKLSEVK